MAAPTVPDLQTAVPPLYVNLSGQVVKEERYFAYGSMSEIYRGIWTPTGRPPQMVALKSFRCVDGDEPLIAVLRRRINRETYVWHHLRHPNVLPFLGVCFGLTTTPALVSPFRRAGNINRYLETNGDKPISRPLLVLGIAQGLQYLHSEGVVHGDLKPQNVLISDRGSPQLCDFGASKIYNVRGFTTEANQGTQRYMAPELFDSESSEQTGQDIVDLPPSPTFKSDIYSFAMVTLQVLSGCRPFYYENRDAKVMIDVSKGIRPAPNRYTAITNAGVWALLQDCWQHNAQQRPPMEVVVPRFAALQLA